FGVSRVNNCTCRVLVILHDDFFFQAEDGIRDRNVTGVQTCALPILHKTSFSFEDPMHFDDLPILEEEFDVSGYPSARINRSQKWNKPYPHEEAMVYPGSETDNSIKVNSRLRGDNLNINVDVIFENGTNGGEKIVVYLIENGIIHDQINYYNDDPDSPFYQAGNPIPDFEHNNVLRESLTHVLGDALPSLDAFEKHSISYELNLDLEYNRDNLEVVVML